MFHIWTGRSRPKSPVQTRKRSYAKALLATFGALAFALVGGLLSVKTAQAELPSAMINSERAATAAPAASTQASPQLAIIPKPVMLTRQSGVANFVLNSTSRLITHDPSAWAAANQLAVELRRSTGFALPVASSGTAGAHDILFTKGEVQGMSSPEAYQMVVSGASGVQITANADHGFFDATRTLKQTLPPEVYSMVPLNANWSIPALTIKDAPRFEYRGVMIDPARSFISKDAVKAIIRQMSELKMTHLHIHLADDQGWRIQITNDGREAGDDIDYTRLTNISGHMAINVHELQGSKELGRTGFYTQEDYKEIVAYAQKHFVTIVPEIDFPGHSNAALHSIPQLNTAGSSHPATEAQPLSPENPTGAVGYSYLDPDSPATWHFIKHVVSQIAAMTPGSRVHIGGDEPWAFKKRYGDKGYAKTLAKILEVVRSVGKNPIGWSEISLTDTQPSDTIHYWVGYQKNILERVKVGTKVLMSWGRAAYLDQRYSPSTALGLTWACKGTCDASQYYNWNPVSTPGLPLQESQVLGVEGALWNETVRGGDQSEFLIWPRAASLAEMGWTPQTERNTNDFLARLAVQSPRWNYAHTNFYDTPQVNWAYDVSTPVSLKASPNQNVTFPIGYVSAAGTKLNNDTITADAANDADGISHSQVPASGLTVQINWGDGSTTQKAHLQNTRARDAYGAPGLYRVVDSHNYAQAGDYTVTLTAGTQSATTTVHIAANTPAPALPAAWDSSQKPAASFDSTAVKPTDRVLTTISGFQPDVPVNIRIGDTLLGQFRPDAQGRRADQYLFIPSNVPSGEQTLSFTQGDRSVSKKIMVTDGRVSLQNPVASSDISLAGVDSESAKDSSGSGPAAAALDGNAKTFWYTRRIPGHHDPFPHWIAFKLNPDKKFTVTGIEYTARTGAEDAKGKDFEVWVSKDGTNYEKVYTGSFAYVDGPQAFNFDRSMWKEAHYVKVVEKNAYSNNSQGGAAEFRVGAIEGEVPPATEPPATVKPEPKPETKPAEPVRPDTKPEPKPETKPAEPTKPTEPAQPTTPSTPAQPVESAKPAESAKTEAKPSSSKPVNVSISAPKASEAAKKSSYSVPNTSDSNSFVVLALLLGLGAAGTVGGLMLARLNKNKIQ